MKVFYEVRNDARGYDEYPDETLVAVHASRPDAEGHTGRTVGCVHRISEDDERL